MCHMVYSIQLPGRRRPISRKATKRLRLHGHTLSQIGEQELLSTLRLLVCDTTAQHPCRVGIIIIFMTAIVLMATHLISSCAAASTYTHWVIGIGRTGRVVKWTKSSSLPRISFSYYFVTTFDRFNAHIQENHLSAPRKFDKTFQNYCDEIIGRVSCQPPRISLFPRVIPNFGLLIIIIIDSRRGWCGRPSNESIIITDMC